MLAVTISAALPGALLVGAISWAGFYLPGLVGGLATLAVYGIIGVASYSPCHGGWESPKSDRSWLVTIAWVTRRRMRGASS